MLSSALSVCLWSVVDERLIVLVFCNRVERRGNKLKKKKRDLLASAPALETKT